MLLKVLNCSHGCCFVVPRFCTKLQKSVATSVVVLQLIDPTNLDVVIDILVADCFLNTGYLCYLAS